MDRVPTEEKLREEANQNPATVRSIADQWKQNTDRDKTQLLAKIDMNKNNGTISESTAEHLGHKTNVYASKVHKIIEETSNTAVDRIDDTEDTAHLLFDLPWSSFVLETPLIRVLFLAYTFYVSGIYSMLKLQLICNFKSYAKTLLVILISSLIIYYIFYCSVINCDAPRAWGLYFQDSASPQMEALVELHEFLCIRIKLRGHPKALTTKDIQSIYIRLN